MENEALIPENGDMTEETTEPTIPTSPCEELTEAAEENIDSTEDGDNTPDFSALAAEDLSALREAFPALADMASLAELPEPLRYGELREAGLSPVEAFCASHHKLLIPRHTDGRTHLSPSIGRASSAPGGRISASALSDARELFPSLSDREIEALYRRVNTAR